jgi:hypothetical protein
MRDMEVSQVRRPTRSDSTTRKPRRSIGLGVVLLLWGIVGAAAGLSTNRAPVDRSPTALSPAAQAPEPLPEPSGHPRLFFSPDNLALQRERARTSLAETWEPIYRYALQQQQKPPPLAVPEGAGLDTFREFSDTLIALAFACALSEEDQLCQTARDYLVAAAGWQQWGENNQRGLGLGHMVQGASLAYDWLYPRLADTDRLTVRGAIGVWAQQLFEASAQPRQDAWNNWWHSSYLQNHYWTIHSALGIAGLALVGEDERADSWLGQASAKLATGRSFLEQMGDGSWHESIPYQTYFLTQSLPFLINLRTLRGQDLIPHTYLRNYVYWRLYNHLPNGQFILTHGDFEWSWESREKVRSLLRFAASEYEDGHAEWLAQQLYRSAGSTAIGSSSWYVFEFFYYNPGLPPQPPSQLAPSRVFPDLEGVIWRTGWERDALVFGFKTGPYGGRFAFDTFSQQSAPWNPPCPVTQCQLNVGHDHADANSFYLFAQGSWLAPEQEGVGKNTTGFHNTILIDGEGQYRPTSDRAHEPPLVAGSDGELEAAVSSPSADYLAADATRPYQRRHPVTEVRRAILFVRPSYFIMLDSLAADEPRRYTWVSHFGQEVRLEEGWVRGDAGNGQILGVLPIAPEEPALALGYDEAPFVHIQTSQPLTRTHFLNLLYPTAEAGWAGRPRATSLGATATAAAIRVVTGDGDQERSDDIIIATAEPDAVAALGQYRFDGRAALISRTSAGLERLVVLGGTSLAAQEGRQLLVGGLDAEAPFEVDYSGGIIFVTGALQGRITLYAPTACQLIVNGAPLTFSRSGEHISFGGAAHRQEPVSASAHNAHKLFLPTAGQSLNSSSNCP